MTPPPGRSLRTQLLWLLAGSTLVLWSLGGWWLYRESRQLADRIADQALQEAGTLLLQLAHHEVHEHGLSLGVLILSNEALPGDHLFRYQIWTPDQRSAYRSEGAPDRPFMPLGASGFGWAELNGERWRAYATWDEEHSLQIQIVQSVDYARGMSQLVGSRLAAALAVTLLLSVLVWWRIIARSFAPLVRTASAIAARTGSDLADVAEAGVPDEVLPLVGAFNRLLGRVRHALQHERRFAADAAHELRTPLAAVRANAQVLRGARNQQEFDQVLRDLIVSVDRGSRVVEQLLVLARAESQLHDRASLEQVDLRAVVELHCAQQLRAASDAGCRLSWQTETCTVAGRSELLAILVRNLLDNATRYAGAGANVAVSLRVPAEGAVFSICDNGPGIPVEDRERVFDRFFRVPGSRSTGSGLGLAIVRHLAELHGARVTLSEGPDGRGLCVTVQFPPGGASS